MRHPVDNLGGASTEFRSLSSAVRVGIEVGPRSTWLLMPFVGCEVARIDVVTSGEHAGSPESPVQYPPPDSAACVDIAGLRLPTLEALVEFKIASGVWGHRAQDLADVQRLIRVNGLTEAFAEYIAPTLREKFLDLLSESRLERDLE